MGSARPGIARHGPGWQYDHSGTGLHPAMVHHQNMIITLSKNLFMCTRCAACLPRWCLGLQVSIGMLCHYSTKVPDKSWSSLHRVVVLALMCSAHVCVGPCELHTTSSTALA